MAYTNTLNTNDLNLVLSELKHFFKVKWKTFGDECGLHNGTLEAIQANNANSPRFVEECFRNTVAFWLRREDDVNKVGEPTLERLADIVEETGDKSTAKKIRIQNGIPVLAKDPDSHKATQCIPINSAQSSTILHWFMPQLPRRQRSFFFLISVVLVVIILISVPMIIHVYMVHVHAPPANVFDTIVTADTSTTPLPNTHSHCELGSLNHTSVINEYASKLRDKYNETLTRYKDPEINKFPAAGPSVRGYVSFVPLKLIRIEKNNTENADFFKQASVEQILDKFESIEIEDIIKPLPNKQLRLILIAGEPGIGKSTLAKELTLRWAGKTDRSLNNFELVIFIQLRLKTYQKAKVIEDLLIKFDDINMTEVMLSINKTRGAEVLWILDGFDELPHHLRTSSSSIFIKLIKGDILSKSTIIVTSRHAATDLLLTYIYLDQDSKFFYLIGFSSNETKEYITTYFKDKKITSEFYSYYSGNFLIENMLYSPINCFVICLVINDFILANNNKYPRTITGIYNQYVRVLLKRHLIDTKSIDINDDMPPYLISKIDFNNRVLNDIWGDFYHFSKIAYNGVMKQEYIFGKELHDVPKLSMMDTIVSFSAFDKDESSSFIHTTLQEYLAAIYLVNNPDSMFTKKDLKQNSNLEAVLTFYVGLLKFIDREVDNKTMDMIFNHEPSKEVLSSDYHDFLSYTMPDCTHCNVLTSLALRCMYEHNFILFNTSFLHREYTLPYHAKYAFRNFDFFICGYIVAAHNITFKLINFRSSDIRAFRKGLEFDSLDVKGRIKVKYGSHFNYEKITTELFSMPNEVIIGLHLSGTVADFFCEFISILPSLQEIVLDYYYYNELYCYSIISGEHPLLKLKNLKKLTLIIRHIFKNIFELLKQLTAPGRPIKKLHVHSWDVMTIHILKLIEMPVSLEELRIELLLFDCQLVWFKIDNSLTVNKYHEFFAEHLGVSKIKLNSFTSFVHLKDKNETAQSFTVTIYSKPIASCLIDF